MTSSPGPKPRANMAACRAAVPEDTATPAATPQKAATAASNSPTAGPVVSHGERNARSTACSSRSSMHCRP